MNFEYYYGSQADQFSFIRIPRTLLLDDTFSSLSLPAKVLYSVLLDRMGLSMKNKWFDKENKVYIIYQIAEIQADLGFSKKKAMDYLAELENFGLIEKKKRGLGLPNLIYVKSFLVQQRYYRSTETETSVKNSDIYGSSEMRTSGVTEKHPGSYRIDTSEVSESNLHEVPKTVPLNNKTYKNHNDQSNIESNHIKSDHDSIRCEQGTQKVGTYSELIKNNIDFEVLLQEHERETDLVEEIFQLILEIVMTEKDTVRIAKEQYPAGL